MKRRVQSVCRERPLSVFDGIRREGENTVGRHTLDDRLTGGCTLRRLATTICVLGIGVTSVITQSAAAADINLELTRTLDLSGLSMPLPDPMGLSYDSTRGRLLVTDSEIDEFDAPYWRGANFFEIQPNGSLDTTVNMCVALICQPNPSGFTDEPADIAFARNPFGSAEGNHYFIADDNSSRIYDVTLGVNGRFDITDTRTWFKTHDIAQDIEGLEFAMIDGEPNLFIASGEGPPTVNATYQEDGSNIHQIFRVRPGSNGRFDGPPGPAAQGDDIVTSFDTCKPTDATPVSIVSPCTSPINQPDPEDVAYDVVSGNLFFTSHHEAPGVNRIIVSETEIDGTPVATWDLGGISGVDPSGIAFGVASGNPNARSLYIASRGIDNDNNRSENDGKILEWQLGGDINHPPVVTNPGSRSTPEGLPITPLTINAYDPDAGQPVSVSVSGLPSGLTFDTSTRVISGTVPYGNLPGGWTPGQTSRPHTVVITATDSYLISATASFTWTVTRDVTAPAMPGSLVVGRQTTGISLDWPDNTEADLAGYRVSRAATVSGTYTDLTPDPLPPGTTEFYDDAAPAGATSYYRVTAFDRAVPANVSLPRAGSARRSKIVLVSSSKQVGSGLLLAIPKPDGVAPGDVLVASVAARDAVTVLAPPGWTLAAQTARVQSLNLQAVYTHTVAADDPAAFTFIAVGRSASVGMIMAYRGAIERPASVAGQANPISDQITAPSLTPAANDSVQIGFFGIDTEALIIAPAGMILREWQTMFVDPLGLSLGIADTVIDATPAGVRIASASSAAENVGQVIVLSPKP
jgi:hypothetical protein